MFLQGEELLEITEPMDIKHPPEARAVVHECLLGPPFLPLPLLSVRVETLEYPFVIPDSFEQLQSS